VSPIERPVGLSDSGGKTGLSTTLGSVAAKAGNARFAIDGLSASSLQLNETFGQGITDANQAMNSLLMMASAAGLGAKGTAMLTQAGKDMVAQMLPMADGSSEATAQLYALAQQAGYQGPDAFQSLVTWVGKTGNAEQNLQTITSKLTVASANLATDVNNLAQALNQTLNQAMATAIFQASGGQAAISAFANAAMKSHGNIDDLKSSAKGLATELLDMTGNTAQAKQEFETLAAMFGIGTTKADQLWKSVVRLAEAESRIPKNVKSTIEIYEILSSATAKSAILKSQGAGGSGSFAGGLASGGQIRSGSAKPGADDNLALLSRDEWVIQAPAVRKYGSRMFEDLNAMRYASGGQVGGSHAAAGTAPPAAAPTVNNFYLEFHGQKPTQEEFYAMTLRLHAAVGSAP